MKQLIFIVCLGLLPLVQSAAPGIYEDFSAALSREMRQEENETDPCTGGGDPHYLNENGEVVHFQGACKYIMAQYADSNNQDMSGAPDSAIDSHEINPWNDMCHHEQFNIFMHGSFVRFETSFGLVVESSGG
ncbi:hypothetical protein CAPTEDRAFT_216707, partial [Capitella teleta]